MNKLAIQLAEERTAFRPREILRGAAEWELVQAPAAVEVRLCWFAQVQGVSEVRVVETVRYDRPLGTDRRNFDFRLPEAPYSYAGPLAMLSWAVELVTLPDKEFTQVFFTMGPGGEVIELQRQLET